MALALQIWSQWKICWTIMWWISVYRLRLWNNQLGRTLLLKIHWILGRLPCSSILKFHKWWVVMFVSSGWWKRHIFCLLGNRLSGCIASDLEVLVSGVAFCTLIGVRNFQDALFLGYISFGHNHACSQEGVGQFSDLMSSGDGTRVEHAWILRRQPSCFLVKLACFGQLRACFKRIFFWRDKMRCSWHNGWNIIQKAERPRFT